MEPEEKRMLRTMRYMAWERAKGELRSMLETYWHDDDKYDIMKEAIDEFIDDVQGHAKQE
jgi:hypothetical protein